MRPSTPSPDGHGDRAAGVDDRHAALQALGGGHGDRAGEAAAEVLLDLEGEQLDLAGHFELDGERLVDGRDRVLGELDVDHGADDLDDFSGVHLEDGEIGRELGGGDLEDFLRDGGLAGLVVFEREVVEQLGGVVLGGLHRDHARAVLGGLGGEDELVDLAVDVERQEGVEHLVQARARRASRGRRAPGTRTVPVSSPRWREEFLEAAQRQDRADPRLLDKRVGEARVDDLDRVDHALEEVLHHQFGDDLHLAEGHPVVDLEARPPCRAWCGRGTARPCGRST